MAHPSHVIQAVCPELVWYLSISQSEQADTFDSVEYLPMMQSRHVLAPADGPVSVIDPGAQLVHAATFDAVEYLPGAHAVHELAPEVSPVLVIEPATHTLQ